MAPHTFFEAEPIRHSSGIDCSTIPHAKSTSCSQSRCVVHSCKNGWIPSPQVDECIPFAMRNPVMRVQKRSSPLSANATADVNISSDLLTQIIAIVDLVLKLPSLAPASSSSQPASGTSSSEISALIGEITHNTLGLLSSTTVSSLVESTDALLSTCKLLSSLLARCGCVQVFGIGELVQELNQLIDAAFSMQNWCNNNPIVPGSPTSAGGGHQPPSISSTPNLPEQPIVIGLSSLLSSLGLNGNSGVVVSGLGNGISSTVNGILNGLSLGPNNYNITSVNPNVTIAPDLLAQIVGLVDLVLNLQGNSASLPPLPASSSGSSISSATYPAPTAPSHPAHSPSGTPSVDVGLIAAIVQALLDILQAPTVSSLISAVDGLVNVNNLVKGALGQCGCVDALRLRPLVANLDAIDNAALEMQNWCHNHLVPVPSSSITASVPHSSGPATTNINNDPIIVGLSDLLTGATLGLLGPVTAGATVDGLGSGLSDTVNGLLAGLGIGPFNFKREGLPLSVDANATATVNSDLLTQIEDLVGLVAKLEGSCTSPSSSGGPTSTSHPQDSVDPGLVANIVQATTDLLQSPTVNSLVTSTDQLINACTALANVFAGCGCVAYLGLDNAVEYLALITKAALGLKNWYAANPIVISPSSSTILSSLPPKESGDLPIVLGLNHLLDGLGLGDIKSVTSIDGLGNGLNSVVNGLLDGLGIGPNGVRRRQPTRRQYSTYVDSQVATEVYALIDLDLGLSDAGSNLPSPVSISPPSTPTPSHTPPTNSTIDTDLVVRVVRATGELLSSKSADQLLMSVDALVAISALYLEAIQSCGCVAEMGLDQVEGYLTRIVNVAEDIQSWAHGHYVLSPSVKPTAVHSPHSMVNASDKASSVDAGPLLPGLQHLVDGILELGVLSKDSDSGLRGDLVSMVNDLLLPPPVSGPGTIRSSAAWKRRL